MWFVQHICAFALSSIVGAWATFSNFCIWGFLIETNFYQRYLNQCKPYSKCWKIPYINNFLFTFKFFFSTYFIFQSCCNILLPLFFFAFQILFPFVHQFNFCSCFSSVFAFSAFCSVFFHSLRMKFNLQSSSASFCDYGIAIESLFWPFQAFFMFFATLTKSHIPWSFFVLSTQFSVSLLAYSTSTKIKKKLIIQKTLEHYYSHEKSNCK